MSTCVFDTDVLSLLMRGRLPEQARRRMARVAPEDAKTTAITLGELHYGALRSAAARRWLADRRQLALQCRRKGRFGSGRGVAVRAA